ncbi:MAG TPA: RHS repeat-associated core domain-containing protein [Chthonomonas sp.]|uniref:RHS repeat-associated core domain-containing protein n=1 Tax=Chthonomonas sp. TaxID=2282153 RepID=UPI002B4AD8FB|nr:RHS repeat-associated core domain-containing protein [Chthonomonas sp.]HLH80034.1 RHS repeat-associated core domain-containing protein [Chthonomonas sp.]
MAWNARNQLQSIINASQQQITYDEDPFGRRIAKHTPSGTRYFLNLGISPLCELDGNGNIVAINTWGPNGLCARHSEGAGRFYAFDPFGNCIAETYGGILNGPVSYDAYGYCYGGPLDLSDPYAGFGGQWGYYRDAETGLYRLGARYYDTFSGRFLSRDPLGYAGSLNLYGYAANNPLAFIDPTGMSYWGDAGRFLAGEAEGGAETVLCMTHPEACPGLGNLISLALHCGIGCVPAALLNGLKNTINTLSMANDPEACGRIVGSLLAGAAAPAAGGASAVGGLAGEAGDLAGAAGEAAGELSCPIERPPITNWTDPMRGPLGERWEPPDPEAEEAALLNGEKLVPYGRALPPEGQEGPPVYEWRGSGRPPRGGNWRNPIYGDLHNDLGHPYPRGPHWDWHPQGLFPDYPGEKYLIFPDGNIVEDKWIYRSWWH